VKWRLCSMLLLMMFTKMQFELFFLHSVAKSVYFRRLNEVNKTLKYVDAFMNLVQTTTTTTTTRTTTTITSIYLVPIGSCLGLGREFKPSDHSGADNFSAFVER